MLSIKQTKFLDFCKEQHGEQVRKYTGEPYWHHLLNVAQIVKPYDKRGVLIPIALGHDLFEDTECWVNDLIDFILKIGYTEIEKIIIVKGIKDLTDHFTNESYPNLNRQERKTMEAGRLSQISASFQTVKYADLIDNTISIAEHDKKFAKVYLGEKKHLLDKMRKGNFDLYLKACQIYQNALESL